MSCEHAETTTLLWLYGEADQGHASHVAECSECADVAAIHADVAVASAGLEAETLPTPANSRTWIWLGATAAAAALLFGLLPSGSVAPVDTGERIATAPSAIAFPLDDLSFELDGLEADLDELSFDLSSL